LETGIVSAPVVDKKNNKFVGLVDVVDILAFVVSIFEEHSETEQADIFKRVATSNKFAKQSIGEITDLTHNPFTSVEVGTSLWEILHLFVNKKSHRCPVLTHDGKMISIFTQSALVAFCHEHVKDLGVLGQSTVHDLHLGTSPVQTMAKTAKTIDAFKYMAENHISGIGICDQSKKLIGNISARDLKVVNPMNIFNSMVKTTGAFISQSKQDSMEENAPVIACKPETHLDFVIGRMTANHIHRLYVCDKDYKPIAIISLRDVLKVILDSCEK
jgi:CBS domain-containing protein